MIDHLIGGVIVTEPWGLGGGLQDLGAVCHEVQKGVFTNDRGAADSEGVSGHSPDY